MKKKQLRQIQKRWRLKEKMQKMLKRDMYKLLLSTGYYGQKRLVMWQIDSFHVKFKTPWKKHNNLIWGWAMITLRWSYASLLHVCFINSPSVVTDSLVIFIVCNWWKLNTIFTLLCIYLYQYKCVSCLE